MLKIEMEHADDSIGPFTGIKCFVNQEVNLTRYGLTTYAKYGTFPWGKEIKRAWLKRVVGEVHLKRNFSAEFTDLE